MGSLGGAYSKRRRSILQAESSFDPSAWRPAHVRPFFEHTIRENLDLGHSDQVELIFNRKIIAPTPG
jgi:hypothetical protein